MSNLHKRKFSGGWKLIVGSVSSLRELTQATGMQELKGTAGKWRRGAFGPAWSDLPRAPGVRGGPGKQYYVSIIMQFSNAVSEIA